MPLCTPTTSDSTGPDPDLLQFPYTWGWALIWLGSPCVAQRVCPIPKVPFNAFPPSVFSTKFERRPFAFTTWASASPSRTARPPESYPLYSRFDSPSNRIGAACYLHKFPAYFAGLCPCFQDYFDGIFALPLYITCPVHIVHPSCVCLCHLNISYIIPLHFLKTFRDIWNKLILHWTYYKESSVIEK